MRGSLLRRDKRTFKKFLGTGWRVFLNGVNVTHRCQAFDEREGTVLLLELDANGRPQVWPDGEGIKRRWYHGRVRAFPPYAK